MDCNSTARNETLTYTLNRIMIPIEVSIGLPLQLLNFIVLQRRVLSQLPYNFYLKAECICSLSGGILLIPMMLRKHNLVPYTQYSVVFYYAHIAKPAINLTLYFNNLILIVLGAQPLYALSFPFHHRKLTGTKRGRTIQTGVIIIIGLVALAAVAPGCFMSEVIATVNKGRGIYCIQLVTNNWSEYVGHCQSAIFELLTIVVIFVTYAVLFVKYVDIQKKHKESLESATSCKSSDGSYKADSNAPISAPAFDASNKIKKPGQNRSSKRPAMARKSNEFKIKKIGLQHDQLETALIINNNFTDNARQASVKLKSRGSSLKITEAEKSGLKTTNYNVGDRKNIYRRSFKTKNIPKNLKTTESVRKLIFKSDMDQRRYVYRSKLSSLLHSSLDEKINTKQVTPSLQRRASHDMGHKGTSVNKHKTFNALKFVSQESLAAVGKTLVSSSKHQKAIILCLGSITASLICNLPSCLLEIVLFVCAGDACSSKKDVFKSWRHLSNIVLVLNSTIQVIVQVTGSRIYRRELRGLFGFQ